MIVWGPSVELITEDEAVRTKLSEMIDRGISVKVSDALAQKYGIRDELVQLGVRIEDVRENLSEMLANQNRQMVSL